MSGCQHVLTGIEVAKTKAGFLQMTIDGQVILLQEDICSINATQILKLCPLTQNQRTRRLKALKDAGKVQYLPAQGTHGHMNAWIDIPEGKALCDKLGLGKKLQPLLDLGTSLHEKYNNNTGSKRILPPGGGSLEAVDRLTFANGSEKSLSPFIELMYNTRRLAIRRSDWKINCSHIASQMAGKSMMPKLLRGLPAEAREVLRLSAKHAGTYVDFDYGIELCKTYKLFPLAVQLLELRRTATERAAAPVLENPVNKSYAVSASPRPANSYHIQSPIIARQPDPKESLLLQDSIVPGYTRKSKSEGSEEGGDSFEADDDSSVDTDITQLHDLRTNISDDEVTSRQSNDDSEVNQNQSVEEKPSYYSFRDFEPHNSELKEVKLGLQAPSRASSRYGSMTDVSRSFWLAASD